MNEPSHYSINKDGQIVCSYCKVNYVVAGIKVLQFGSVGFELKEVK